MPEATPMVDKGSKVWYHQNASSWISAEVVQNNGQDTLSLRLQDNQIVDNVSLRQVHPANPAVQDAIPDVTQLSYLNEPGILHNLLQRYQQDVIYTAAGPVLIALNPCRNLQLYTTEVAGRYKAGCLSSSCCLDPHIFGVAGAAFRDMLRLDTSQSIVINGESGAGKTETAKKAMQFLTALAGGTGIDQQVLKTNPILEAFGNAKTQRNRNSSRFGKLIEIHFTNSNQICGARIKTYLLEKNRVVHQLPGERSFHIFYQLLRGVTDPVLRRELNLPDEVTAFANLAKSGCTDLPGVDDAANFSEVLQALADIGLDSQQVIKPLLATLSGILWLGNLRLEAGPSEDSSRVAADVALSNAAALLCVKEDELAQAITHKKIQAGAESIVKTLKPAEAADARDALAKSLYAGVFEMIVAAINARLDIGRMASGRFIAILDIYGFEHFETNSFEQLCINYANERLQQQFSQHLFTQEQELYESEGIDWTKIDWVDNQGSLDVIETNSRTGPGLLSVLNTLCKISSSTDEKFLTELRNNLCDNDCWMFKPQKPNEFVIKHYAADVAYDVTGFLDKNRDTLNQDLIDLLCSSSNTLVSQIGTAAAPPPAAESRPPARPTSQSRPSSQSVSSKFSSQLMDLIAMLDSTGLHFVRCIKPNATLEPQVFVADTVLQQLRCCGVLEVARVAQAGYPTRYKHQDFVERYRVLLPAEEEGLAAAAAAVEGDAGSREAVQHLLGVFGVSDDEVKLGSSTVFLKTGVLGQVEDQWAKMQSAALKIQTTWRMCVDRKQYLAVRSAARVIQSSWRARAHRAEINRRAQAAVIIQRGYRSYVARQKILHAIYLVREAHRAGQIDQGLSKRIESQVATAGAIDDLMLQYGILDMAEVHTALECYSSLKNQPVAAGSKGPGGVKESLQLLAILRSAAEREPLTAETLEQQLRVAALCQEHLGPEVNEEQLQELIDAAAAAEEDAQAQAAAMAREALLRQAAAPSSRYSSRAAGSIRGDVSAQKASEAPDATLISQQRPQDVACQERMDHVSKKSRSLLSRAKDTVGRLTGQQASKPAPVPPRVVSSVARPNMASTTARPTMARDPAALHNALAMALAAERGVANPDALKESLAANVQLKKEVASLRQQLESEKMARMKFAKQQEQLALEWKSQVKVLESYIRSMQAELAAQSPTK